MSLAKSKHIDFDNVYDFLKNLLKVCPKQQVALFDGKCKYKTKTIIFCMHFNIIFYIYINVAP